MSLRTSCWFLLVLMFGLQNVAFAGEGAVSKPPAKNSSLPTLIVFSIVPERGVDKSLSNLISELVIDKIAKLGRYTVMGQKDLEKMLSWEQNKQLQGCTDTACLVQLAGAMGASFYVEGSIGVVGDQYLITLKLIDADKVIVKERATEKTAKDEKIIVGSIEGIVDRIMGVQEGVGARHALPLQNTTTTPVPDKSLTFRNWGMGLTFSGIGVAGIGGTMTAMAFKAGDDKRNATDAKGIKNAQDQIDTYNVAAVAMYSVGGAAIVTGVVLWVLSALDKKPVGSARAERGPTLGDMAFTPVFTPGFGGMAVGGEW